MKRFLVPGILICAVLGLGLLLIPDCPSQSEVTRQVTEDLTRLEELAGAILEAGEVSPEMSYKNYEIACYPEKGMVEFQGPGWGLGSSTRYTGFYYSASGDPLGFQGSQPTFTRDGEGWRWEEPAGDNWEYTQEITPNWYWFEMHF